MPETVIFQFLCPARTAHKGAQAPPLCELLAWKSFGGLGLRASNIQRFARIQIVRKGQSWVQICLNRSTQEASREEYQIVSSVVSLF